MPKNIIDYSKGVVYEIVCKDINIPNKYAGSTCNFKYRKHNHKSSCNNENSSNYNSYVYQFIRENGGWDNWQMLQICEYPCQNKHELLLKEREYIELLQCDLNKNIPTRTKDEFLEKRKEYHNVNKDKIGEYTKEYYEKNKDKIDEYNKEYQKKYTELNKEQIKLKRKEHFICECGSSVTIYEKQRHYRSQKHCQFIISQKITIK